MPTLSAANVLALRAAELPRACGMLRRRAWAACGQRACGGWMARETGRGRYWLLVALPLPIIAVIVWRMGDAVPDRAHARARTRVLP